MEEIPVEEPRPLAMPPLVLLAGTRPAFLLARARTVAGDRPEWWAKLAIPLDAGTTGDGPRVDYQWVSFAKLTKVEGVDYSAVPTLPRRDDQ